MSSGHIASPWAARWRRRRAARLRVVGWSDLRRDDPTGDGAVTRPTPSSYYGVHKLAAEGHVSLAGIPFAIARPSNIYGPIQTGGLDGAVVAAFVEAASATGSVRIDGDGSQTRDFVDVRDAVDALVSTRRSEHARRDLEHRLRAPRLVAELADLVESGLGRPVGRQFAPSRRRRCPPLDDLRGAVAAAWLATSRRIADGVRELIGSRD